MKSDSPQVEIILRFLELNSPSPAGRLLLIQHPRPFNPQIDQVHYRLNQRWIPFSTIDRGGWEFLDDEMISLASDYINLLEYYWEDLGVEDDVVASVLQSNAVEWYDSTSKTSQQIPDFKKYTSGTQNFEIVFLNDDRCQINLVTGDMLWVRSDDNGWTFQSRMTRKDRARRSALRRVATEHLKRAVELADEDEFARENELEAEVARYTAFCFGASFAIKPELADALLAIEAEDLSWNTVKPMLVLDFTSEGPIYFVTPNDPEGGSNFELRDLVMGSLDDGTGVRRTAGIWVREHIAALDWENHMPTDERDMSPWGGEYLYGLDDDTAGLAIDFWDQMVPGRIGLNFSDFVAWLRQNAVDPT